MFVYLRVRFGTFVRLNIIVSLNNELLDSRVQDKPRASRYDRDDVLVM